jgi:RNA polymerase sigma factor (sigma-70 family)
VSKRRSISRCEEYRTCPSFPPSESFWNLWLTHCSFLQGLSLRWMRGCQADAEDALSTAKLKAAVHFCAYSEDLQNHRAWLARLLYTSCMDLHRWRRRERTTTDNLLEDVAMLSEADARPSPEKQVLDLELRARLARLLDELPEPWRNAVLERGLGQKSYEEIARQAGTTPANVRKRVQLARALLKRRLASG